MNPQEPQFSGIDSYRLPEKKPKQLTLALMSFIFSLLPVLLCFCTIYSAVTVFLILLSLLALIFGITSLATHKDGKGFAISGIIVSVLMIPVLVLSLICVNSVYFKDMMKFSEHAQEYVEEYDATGEIPEEFQKYSDPKYDTVWKSMGMDSFEEFYGDFIKRYKQQNPWMFTSSDSSGSSSSNSGSSESSTKETTTRPANYGEELITI